MGGMWMLWKEQNCEVNPLETRRSMRALQQGKARDGKGAG